MITTYWQQIVVALALLGCAVWMGRRMYRSWDDRRRGVSACDGCAADCGLRDLKKNVNTKDLTTFASCKENDYKNNERRDRR
ncbi:MAG: FeoB-associated Cys-rich membrane protein [Prevotellaceae bacterium]|jgi:hypothetical protein|nr:FeoB-associated Cys-rich membrane protein [Prevotellaceae bacterium]